MAARGARSETMKRWLLFSVSVTEAAIVLGAVYFEPTYGVRGWLWGEAFFEGKPTSWWRKELEGWEFAGTHRIKTGKGNEVVLGALIYPRNLTWYEQTRELWFPTNRQVKTGTDYCRWISPADPSVPHILHGSAETLPVLRELLEDRSPKIRLFAQIGLKIDPM